jgi:raffinose/stachyose/melibiose transport system substrate-binding protein
MKRRIILALFIAVCFLFVLSVMAFGAEKAKKTIEFWSWNNEGDYPFVHEYAETRYEKANPGVDVKREYISYAEYMVKLKAVLAGGTPPDVFQIPWAGEYTELARSGKLVPLTEPLKKGFPKFFENVMKAISVDGQAWAVPLDLNTLQIAYNIDMFEEYGIEIPQSTDELIATCKNLAKKGKFGIALGTKDLWAGADVFFAQVASTDPTHTKMALADAGKYPWTSPEFVKAAENVVKMVKGGVFAPGANSMEVFVGAMNLFVQQQAAMFYPVGNFVTGGITKQVEGAFEYSLFPMPPLKKGDPMLSTGGVAEMFVVAKDGKNIDTSIDFLRYMTNDEGKEKLVEYDYIPSSEYKGDMSNLSDLYKNMLNAQSKTQSRVIYNTKVYTAAMNGMQGMVGGEMTAKQFIDSLVKASKE